MHFPRLIPSYIYIYIYYNTFIKIFSIIFMGTMRIIYNEFGIKLDIYMNCDNFLKS